MLWEARARNDEDEDDKVDGSKTKLRIGGAQKSRMQLQHSHNHPSRWVHMRGGEVRISGEHVSMSYNDELALLRFCLSSTTIHQDKKDQHRADADLDCSQKGPVPRYGLSFARSPNVHRASLKTLVVHKCSRTEQVSPVLRIAHKAAAMPMKPAASAP